LANKGLADAQIKLGMNLGMDGGVKQDYFEESCGFAGQQIKKNLVPSPYPCSTRSMALKD